MGVTIDLEKICPMSDRSIFIFSEYNLTQTLFDMQRQVFLIDFTFDLNELLQ